MKTGQLFNQRVIVTSSIVLAMLIASMDTTILNTTMPVIAAELGNKSLYAWAFTSYILVSTALIPIAGRLADLFGRKRLFSAGIVIFLLGSLLCGMSVTLMQLIIFRGVQGIGAGIMMPLVQIIAGDIYEVKDRGKIQALFTSMWMLSGILAPIIGAFFVEFTTWRWIFYINIPVSIIALGMLIPYKDVYEARREPIDWLGALLFAAGTAAILIITVVENWRLVYGAAGLSLLLLFVLHERRHKAPMIPGRIVHNKTILWLLANNFIICAALFGLPTYIPLYLQDTGESVMFSGIALIAMSVGWMFSSINSGRWIIKYGYRPLLLIGNIALVIAAMIFVFSGQVAGYGMMFAGLLVLGASFGLIFTVSIIAAQQLVAPHDKGISTSLQMFVRNTGLAFGVSVMGYMYMALNDGQAEAGIQTIYVYGIIGAAVAMVIALFIRERTMETGQVQVELSRKGT